MAPEAKARTATENCAFASQNTIELENRIRQELLDPKQPPSPYDTAWVAMVPEQGAPQVPRFPAYVEWILGNQKSDGSWGFGGNLSPCLLGKVAISSTLACILALKTWNVGHEHIRKGLHFLEKNMWCIMDEKIDAPIGFNIIFPAMLKLGIDLGLEFPLKQSDVEELFRLREMELQRTMNGDSMALGRKAYMAYIAEGLADIVDWDEVQTYQLNNGSLFNSPSATAALAINSDNVNAHQYLEFLGNKFVNSAPAVHPFNVRSQLCLVDTLENMGISSHFSCEISSILDMTYRSVEQNDEEIIMDMETCAMAFRMLRMHGYDISSDILSHFAEESIFHDSVEGHLNNSKALLELYKASLVRISEDEETLEKIGLWSGKLLEEQLRSNRVSRSISPKEVDYALKTPFYSAILEPLQHRMNIESFYTKGVQMQKSSYLARHAAEDILALATEKFHVSQSMYQQNHQCIEKWVKDAGLDRLKFARVMSWDAFAFMASAVFPPELHDVSIAWIQNSILTVIADDFFDDGGSIEELKNFIALIEKWDEHAGIEFCSEDVEILFRAVYEANNDIAAKGAVVQNRVVVDHIAEVWLKLVNAYMVEADWARTKYVPTMEEYIPVAEVSIALGPVVMPALYLLGPELTEDMIRHPEYDSMLKHMSIPVRLLNDIRTYKKEMREGCTNSVRMLALRDDPSMSPASIEAAEIEIRRIIANSRMELLRLLVTEGVVPRPCREIFWNTYKIAHCFYAERDGFSKPQDLVAAVNAVVHEPLRAT
ncbi:unnamed protein product [Urochloa decumbens]|uniref:Uncharacterized protein n=1 Tax=Urochloa decumbens TaxID=240449 RepID=A0ABC9EZM8_9POAL